MVGSDLPVLCPNFPEVTKTDVLIMKDYGDKGDSNISVT